MLALRWTTEIKVLLEEFEDTKGVIRIRLAKKNRQHNDQKKNKKQQLTMDKKRSTKHTQKTSDRVRLRDALWSIWRMYYAHIKMKKQQ